MMREAVRPLYWMVLSSVPTLSTLKASDQRQFPQPSMQMWSSWSDDPNGKHKDKQGEDRKDSRHERLGSVPCIYPQANASKQQETLFGIFW